MIAEHLGMVGIQETKKEVINSHLVQQFWDRSSFDFCYGSAIGQSGGTLLMWNEDCFVKESTFCGNFFSGG